jgi:predicted PhzF superfamily epimerase YddE/YHI9
MNDEDEIRGFDPDFVKIAQLKARGLIITAPGNTCDFVSRCFFPSYGIDEDPVTGSAHTLLAPFWGQQMEKKDLSAQQLSARGGEIKCRLSPDRVYLHGRAVTYMIGKIYI